MDAFAVRLRQERRRLGLNQAELANAGGVQKHAQLNYEKGMRHPDASYLAGIAKVGVDVLYLLTGRPSDPSTLALDPDEERLLFGYRQLKPREKRGVQGLVAAMLGASEGDTSEDCQDVVG
ncbi:helix-turn-helix domain-containing protein [Paraburkholderia silvatlantica]|uniref:Transcriptional regulator with XRE-family HTH domain n=1 Tax=Paraburkholderia silvatlantica TaxID=321895 RepID=A0ABR6FZ57_9BURK|nr:helix-turn-helix transcriptional regulator [Paraburkholderia silvatlantica]MBB2932725.1 transcriptional regulator with XRE-family HTH domain [Paraburkholderia silvatlantica]PVY21475.1 transcriptional regulator with XRE-family HTH domain [Paraburkholderia silvatlantica]PXW26072.1 transcriptional regulator with XRE-family HTH domain [Paraburkholderia silvatlantica]